MTKDYSQAGVDALKAKFEKEEGTRTDTFDSYVNKMASAYQLMKDRSVKILIILSISFLLLEVQNRFLFVLVGTTVDLKYAESAGIFAVLLIIGALLFRMSGVALSLVKTDLSKK